MAPYAYRFPIGERIFYISARTEQAAYQAAEDIADYLLHLGEFGLSMLDVM